MVVGPASGPRVSFSSSPALPDDEVLAQLLFSKNLTSLSPAQIVQLASALSMLTGAGGNAGILDRLRQTIGVDNLDISTDATGENAAIGAGRYINDRAYVGVKQGTTAGSTSVTTSIDLTDGLKAKGEVDAQGKTKGGLFFEKEY
jgi:translocation and assembly module TamB